MEQTTIKTSVKEKFIALRDEFNFPYATSDQAKFAFLELDFPTTRAEDWRYTRTGRISNENWKINTPASLNLDITPYLIPELNAHVIVFINGFYAEQLSSKSKTSDNFEISFDTKTPILREQYNNYFQALADNLCTAQCVIKIGKNNTEEKPIHLLHIITDELSLAQPQVKLLCESSSQAHIVESFVSSEKFKSFSNRTLYIHLKENANLTFDKIQMEGDENFLLNEENIEIEQNGLLTINTISMDGGWIRNNLNIELNATGIEANLHGVYLPRNKQHVDNHTKVDHKAPHCNSNELYKGIMFDQASGVFNGKVYVRPDAQKTNAFQSNANILMSDDAQVNTKPELEIYADDVKCSHGTTTGQMDENALFYLKSRGLGDESARKLLSTAFINDVLLKVKHESVRNFVISELSKREILFHG